AVSSRCRTRSSSGRTLVKGNVTSTRAWTFLQLFPRVLGKAQGLTALFAVSPLVSRCRRWPSRERSTRGGWVPASGDSSVPSGGCAVFGLEWREVVILACVGGFWLLVLNWLVLGLRSKAKSNSGA